MSTREILSLAQTSVAVPEPLLLHKMKVTIKYHQQVVHLKWRNRPKEDPEAMVMPTPVSHVSFLMGLGLSCNSLFQAQNHSRPTTNFCPGHCIEGWTSTEAAAPFPHGHDVEGLHGGWWLTGPPCMHIDVSNQLNHKKFGSRSTQRAVQIFAN